MNVLDAAYATVHDYKGGAAALAPRISKKLTEAVLNSKVNPNTTTHHLRLDEAVKIMVLTGDYQMLDAICAELGKVCVDIPKVGEVSDSSVFKHLLESGQHQGTFYSELHKALEDGVITDSEFTKVEAEAYKYQKSVSSIVNKIEAMKSGEGSH